MITVRVLGPDDWQAWRDLRLAALADAPDAFGSQLADWQGATADRWRARLSVEGSHNLIALLDGVPAGLASGLPASAGAAELTSLWVAPGARGRGVGDRLVDEVEAWARAAGAHEVRLDVADGNQPAVRLYERHGFAFTGELGDVMPDGVRRERVMRKRL